MSDRGYINLIRHLTRSTSTLPLETLQASIAHYLARPPVPVPGTPTVLAATVLGSALFRPYTHTRLSALALAFRHAVHLRVGVLKEEDAESRRGGPFARGVNVPARLAQWVGEVREGFKGSDALVRLACASGLLLGLEEWETEVRLKEKDARARAKVEEEVVLALAEVVEEYAAEGSGWEKDFKRAVGAMGDDDPLALAVLLASQCAQCVDAERLQALPLAAVADVLMTTIDRSFHGGEFLAEASASVSTNAEGKFTSPQASPFAQTIHSVASSAYIASMASLARFLARSLTVLVESRRAAGWDSIGRILARLQYLTATVEKDWERCPLAQTTKDEDFADDMTREVATTTWSILKTLLFTTLMISQAILSAVVFVPSPAAQNMSHISAAHPHTIALSILGILSHLSFVMPQFGGVTSTTEGGLPELKRAFYMALDVLSSNEAAAERFVTELCQREGVSRKGKGVDTLPRPLLDARRAFALACIEQLVPTLSAETIETCILPLCLPLLWDPTHRETYESAHSVMLSIFAAHAKGYSASPSSRKPEPTFAEKLVPMYAQCLTENSSDGKLNATQLCMAYAALVRSASSFGHNTPSESGESVEGDTLAWFCIETLLGAMRQIPSSTPSAPSEHLHRLHLALVASVPAVSLPLLPRLLDEVKSVIVSLVEDGRAGEMRGELVQALFKGILQDVGDAEKEYAIGWWLENREALVGSRAAEDSDDRRSLVARL